jgi:hypothetical protein
MFCHKLFWKVLTNFSHRCHPDHWTERSHFKRFIHHGISIYYNVLPFLPSLKLIPLGFCLSTEKKNLILVAPNQIRSWSARANPEQIRSRSGADQVLIRSISGAAWSAPAQIRSRSAQADAKQISPSRSWADQALIRSVSGAAWADPQQIRSRSGADPEQIRCWIGVYLEQFEQIRSRYGADPEPIRSRSVADQEQIRSRSGADQEQIRSRSGADPEQVVGVTILPGDGSGTGETRCCGILFIPEPKPQQFSGYPV